MAINFSTLVYKPAYDLFAIPVTFIPVISQPGRQPYEARGILGTQMLNVLGEDGHIYSDQKTILDIRAVEFGVLPQQRDRVFIPVDCNGAPQGEYEIIDLSTNGGGETTLTIRRIWGDYLPGQQGVPGQPQP